MISITEKPMAFEICFYFGEKNKVQICEICPYKERCEKKKEEVTK